MATTARVESGVLRPVWWLGEAETWLPIVQGGYPKEVPYWILIRWMASVSSLHQIWGQ